MTSYEDWFHTNEPILGGLVFIGNNYTLEIIGIGTIKLKMHDGSIYNIQYVQYIKWLHKNLLSLG
jgi:beta-N-acetylglucosaminidase